MATENWVNIVSGNGLLPDGTKPLPEPMLHQYGAVTFIWGQCYKRYLIQQLLKSDIENYLIEISFKSPRGQWVKMSEFMLAKDAL